MRIRKVFSVCFVICLITSLLSCKDKTKYGDFTLITEKDKYEALGGALKIDGHNLEYKGNKIDWSKTIGYAEDPNIEHYEYINSADKRLLVEVSNNYYLLIPNGEKLDIKPVAVASNRAGLFESRPYSELLKNDLYFHQAGMLLNLQTFKKDSLLIKPTGRLLATDENLNKIIYLDGIFDNDTNLKKTLDDNNTYLQTGKINSDYATFGYTDIRVLEWNRLTKKQHEYSYTDTTLFRILDEYYKDKSYSAITKSFDSSFVFGLFKWSADSTGQSHLIPKKAAIRDITFVKIDSTNIF